MQRSVFLFIYSNLLIFSLSCKEKKASPQKINLSHTDQQSIFVEKKEENFDNSAEDPSSPLFFDDTKAIIIVSDLKEESEQNLSLTGGNILSGIRAIKDSLYSMIGSVIPRTSPRKFKIRNNTPDELSSIPKTSENANLLKSAEELEENFQSFSASKETNTVDQNVELETLGQKIKEAEKREEEAIKRAKELEEELEYLRIVGAAKEKVRILELESKAESLKRAINASEQMNVQFAEEAKKAKLHLLMKNLEESSKDIEINLVNAGFSLTGLNTNGGRYIEKDGKRIGLYYSGVIQLDSSFFKKESEDFIKKITPKPGEKICLIVENGPDLNYRGYNISSKSGGSEASHFRVYNIEKYSRNGNMAYDALNRNFPDFSITKQAGGGASGEVFFGTYKGQEAVGKRLAFPHPPLRASASNFL